MKEQLIGILSQLKGDVDYANQKNLVDDGIIDSLILTRLIVELEDAFDIEIEMEDLVSENFNSVDAMIELITRLQ